MKKIKDLINKIKRQVLNISTITWILFICGAINTGIIFGGISICLHPSYGGAIASLIASCILACFGTKFNIKETLCITIGSIVTFLLILFAML